MDEPTEPPSAADNGQAGAEPEVKASAVAVAVGDTAELTALDPHEDHLPEVAGPVFPVGLRGYDRAAVVRFPAEDDGEPGAAAGGAPTKPLAPPPDA